VRFRAVKSVLTNSTHETVCHFCVYYLSLRSERDEPYSMDRAGGWHSVIARQNRERDPTVHVQKTS
jgi:hypothetical protein